jgi:hypothetical protein
MRFCLALTSSRASTPVDNLRELRAELLRPAGHGDQTAINLESVGIRDTRCWRRYNTP